MAVATIEVQGMTCQGCVKSVTKALQAVDGVTSTDVSLEKNQATVTYEEGKTTVSDLKLAIEDAGYDVA
ncbi:heavy-metal-associated domain-containing protein [Ferroacidibacillus organovorans]|uniref:Copper chaperone CopZ n=1 Tax=Ferroacidibacillus organovorans TaxID=1765683 RepID=A0A162SWV9_9BACL|nr:copper ion binding protein [Ferroacidibacillus organovorans]KYP80232.1 copper-binding protein [Ferroacidibacillus organovorans]OAG84956.1 copper-binding protein [Ferroacidibacillus organovorans]OAG93615.1 copper-binding protein [Ferroacidibacillus organovorans]OPG15433.1 copper-binding protein [Ferroacidibacillus organovorans]